MFEFSQGFVNNCYKIVSPILLQELIKNFVACKQCSGTLLLVEDVASSEQCSGTLLLVEDVASSDGFGRMWNFRCEKENCLSNSLKARPITPKRNRYFEINRAAV